MLHGHPQCRASNQVHAKARGVWILAGKNLKPLRSAGKADSGGDIAESMFSRWLADYRLSIKDLKQKLLERDAPAAAQWSCWFSSEEPLPSIFEVLLASINIMETRITQSRLAFDRPDVIIQLPLGHIRLLEFGRAAEIIAIGYEHTQSQLALLSPRG